MPKNISGSSFIGLEDSPSGAFPKEIHSSEHELKQSFSFRCLPHCIIIIVVNIFYLHYIVIISDLHNPWHSSGHMVYAH